MKGTSNGQDWHLMDAKTGDHAEVGQVYISDSKEGYMLTGGRPPMHDGSTGRVWVNDSYGRSAEYFPSVIGLKWIIVE